MVPEAIPRDHQGVVAVGAGVAGLTASLAAVQAGAKTTVLEKAPDISDTNTSRSGGAIAFAKEREMHPDAERLTPQEMADKARQISRGHCLPELVKTWRENIDDTLQWLQDSGLRVTTESAFNLGRSSLQVLGKGAGLNKQLLAMAQNAGVNVLFQTRAEKLLQDNKGKVVGVRAMTPEGLKDFIADGVVLATAGFQANQEMLMKYLGAKFAYGVKLTGSPFSTGDGHIMVQELGARLINMDQYHCRQIDRSWAPGTAGHPGPRQLQPFQHYGIFVNRLGKRFMDEYGLNTRSNSVSCSILGQPGMEVAYIWDEEIKAKMGEKFNRYLPEGIIIKAQTLEELAEAIEVPAAALKRTAEEFNRAVKDGKALDLGVPKSDFAFKIEHPPFYAIYPAWGGMNCTLGGPQITPRAEVVNRDGTPIPGLYACGEMIGGFFFGDYYATPGGTSYYEGTYQVITSSLSACIVFARIAGREAAKLRGR